MPDLSRRNYLAGRLATVGGGVDPAGHHTDRAPGNAGAAPTAANSDSSWLIASADLGAVLGVAAVDRPAAHRAAFDAPCGLLPARWRYGGVGVSWVWRGHGVSPSRA
ncbi:hypothetical protein ABFW14_28025, partial [Mycolicibacterium fortuitum]|uniref:hypothetical protein n=1 Tax=Mycolicibacterium fortuitum TaxID=1766 RepID=UPI0034CF3003